MKNKKIKPLMGMYVNNKSEAELKRAQYLRTLFMLLSTLLFAIWIFIDQDALKKLFPFLPLTTIYVLIVTLGIVISVITALYNSRSHKIKNIIAEENAPKKGFAKRTFFSFELFMYMHFLLFAMQFALTIYVFDLVSSLCSFLMAGSAALSVMARVVSYRALSSGTEYIPPAKTEVPQDEEQSDSTKAEEFYSELNEESKDTDDKK